MSFPWTSQEVNPLFLLHLTHSAVLEAWECDFPSMLAYKPLEGRACIPIQPWTLCGSRCPAPGWWKKLSQVVLYVWAARGLAQFLTLFQWESAF